ncbi:MAG TPA: plastocyanin/azurin family copper-binding protein [Thermoleophilaceae bacterium]|nr:plastocyanin/azurin family copper-binding protein [Thermoleophilaceae bacterium]
MRLHRLLPIPLALLLALAAAAPASAAEVEVGVVSFDFEPATRAIGVGDTVIWSFNAEGHTTTANRGQAERWDSGNKGFGQSFRHTFTRPGRFQYVCTPHAGFMKGTIQVGTDQVRDTVDAFKARRSGSSVKVSFKLNEAATATYKLRGAERRTVRRGRLGAGRHSFTVRNLDAGSYSGTLTLKDDFDKSAKPKSTFTIR